MRSRTLLAVALATSLAVAAVPSALKTFDFADPKGVNSVQWFIDSPLEPIAGSAEKVTGTIELDPTRPDEAKGSLTIPTASLRAPVPMMTEHLHGKMWADAEQFPEIKFTLKRVSDVSMQDKDITAKATGDLTLKGVTKEVTADVRAFYVEGGKKVRLRGAEGDTFKIRTDFKINRSDFGVGPADTTIVGDTIELRVAVTGMTP